MDYFISPEAMIEKWKALAERSFWGNTAEAWLLALGIALGVYVIIRLALWIATQWIFTKARLEGEGAMAGIGHVLRKTSRILVLLFALYLGSLALNRPASADGWLRALAAIVIVVQVGLWANAALTFFVNRFERKNLETAAGRVTTMRAAGFIGRLALFSVLLIIALDNIPGVEVTALLASLGVGGVAVALATQNILADLFASLSISLDRPFVIGDFIIVGEFMGTVENVGLKTTRVRSLSGEQLVFSNNDLLSSRIRNYKRMAERRVVFHFGVLYQTTAEQLEAIPPMVRAIIEQQDKVRFDRAHFWRFGDSSLDFEAVYYVLDPDYTVYMDAQQAINLAIFKGLAERGVDFAYPTRTLYLRTEETPEGGWG